MTFICSGIAAAAPAAWCSLWTPSSVLSLWRSLCLVLRGKGKGHRQLGLEVFVFWVLQVHPVILHTLSKISQGLSNKTVRVC